MNTSQHALDQAFAKNRTEEIGHDVWRHFVVPPFFERLDLQKARKPRVIIGGRGCGKTMLLRYLSYQSTFSEHRPDVPVEALSHIGLYWRADTQFSRTMTQREVAEETWSSAFRHFVALVLSIEVLESVLRVAERGLIGVSREELLTRHLPGLADYDPELLGSYSDAQRLLKRRLRQFGVWVNNVKKAPEPVFLPGRSFVVDLVDQCRNSIAGCGNAEFYVYIDEYENLLPYQQRIINTDLKHSETPLIFNVATKRNGMTTTQTVGDENIVDVADYRRHDIEEYLQREFGVFAAEVLLLTLGTQGWSVPVGANVLRDPEQASRREDEEYRKKVLDFAKGIFPGLTHSELARNVMQEAGLRRRLERRIEEALKQKDTSLSVQDLVTPNQPEATIVASALLYRDHTPQEVVDEISAKESGRQNRFDDGQWIHNNLYGCILNLYEGHSQVCPLFAGFDAFTTMARGNLRHFLELCHRSLAGTRGTKRGVRVSTDVTD